MYNIFNRAVDRAVMPFASSLGKGMVKMVTYGDLFTFVIMICAVITLARNGNDKK